MKWCSTALLIQEMQVKINSKNLKKYDRNKVKEPFQT